MAASSSSAEYGAWFYLAVFALMALSFAGVPAVGAAVVGWACVAASQGKASFAAILVAAILGTEAGGLAGYAIGDRWARKLLERPGRFSGRLRDGLPRAEAIYAKWGRLAVFFTSTIISGLLRMKYSQFVVWNFICGAVYVLSVGPAAYGAGKIVASEQDGGSLTALVIGVVIAAGSAWAAVWYYRRRRVRRLRAAAGADEASPG